LLRIARTHNSIMI